MPSMTFVPGTVIPSTWLNDINGGVFNTLPASISATNSLLTSSLETVSLFTYMNSAQIADVQAGTLSVDTSTAFVTALATGKPISIPTGPGWKYLISTTVVIPSGAKLVSQRAQIFLGTGVNANVFTIASAASNVYLEGLHIDGNKANNTAGNGVATTGVGATNVNIRNCMFTNCFGNGLYLVGTTAVDNVLVQGCSATTNTGGGIVGDTTISHFVFSENRTWSNTGIGIGVLGTATYGNISSNVSWSNSENISAFSINNTFINISGNTCHSATTNGIHIGGSDISVTGNSSNLCTQSGIIVSASASGTSKNINVNGNISNNNTTTGITLNIVESGSVSSNTTRSNTSHGIYLTGLVDSVSISNNSILSNGGSGILNAQQGANLTIINNICRVNLGNGIDISEVSNSVVSNNVTANNAGWGINTDIATQFNLIAGNQLFTNTVGTLNVITNGLPNFATNNNIDIVVPVPTVTATPTTTPLPPTGELVILTGTSVVITTLPRSFPGRKLSLYVTTSITFTDGGNLKLNGNFVANADDILTLVCLDGVNWYEVSRSPN